MTEAIPRNTTPQFHPFLPEDLLQWANTTKFTGNLPAETREHGRVIVHLNPHGEIQLTNELKQRINSHPYGIGIEIFLNENTLAEITRDREKTTSDENKAHLDLLCRIIEKKATGSLEIA